MKEFSSHKGMPLAKSAFQITVNRRTTFGHISPNIIWDNAVRRQLARSFPVSAKSVWSAVPRSVYNSFSSTLTVPPEHLELLRSAKITNLNKFMSDAIRFDALTQSRLPVQKRN